MGDNIMHIINLLDAAECRSYTFMQVIDILLFEVESI